MPLHKYLIKKALYMQNPKNQKFLEISQPKKQTEAKTWFTDPNNKKATIFEILQKSFFCLKDTHLDYFVFKNHKNYKKIVSLASIFQFFFQNRDFPEIWAKILKSPYRGRQCTQTKTLWGVKVFWVKGSIGGKLIWICDFAHSHFWLLDSRTAT